MSNPLFVPAVLLRRFTRRLWVRVSLYAVAAILIAIAGVMADDLLPSSLSGRFSADTILPILTILASSMLAVSTFSLNVMVSAHRSAAQNATPRIRRILMEDTTTQNVLATFIGAFVYSLTGIIISQLGGYSEKSGFLVIIVTVAVVIMVVLAILRWIEHLGELGSLDQNLKIVHHMARDSLNGRVKRPNLGCIEWSGKVDELEDASAITAQRSGIVQLLDVGWIETRLAENDKLYILRNPGSHVLKGEALAYLVCETGESSCDSLEDHLQELGKGFVLGDIRSHEQDPEFGLLVMSEISSKALSPGVNDPGTAIETIRRLEALLWNFANDMTETKEPSFQNIHMKPTGCDELVEAAFGATARDGAGTIEVAIILRKALLALSRTDNEPMKLAITKFAETALSHSRKALAIKEEIERLEAIEIPA